MARGSKARSEALSAGSTESLGRETVVGPGPTTGARVLAGEGGSPVASRPARWAIVGILGVHGILLLSTLGDYRVSIDSGYHVSLARYYAEHGTAFWDHINYGPAGRPNLQGPALHVAIALLGRLIGGTGSSYVLANAILGVAQWAAAMWTVVFFARRWRGDRAALLSVALLSGSAACAISFAVGIPSGWIFIVTPWAIHFFLADNLLPATLFTVVGIYTHLGGFVTAPIGILVSACLTRRWRNLIIVGAATTVLSAPYLVHFIRYREWYRGEHGHVALNLSILVALLSIAGFAWAIRRPRQNAFLIAWFLAPVAWIFQDYTRFIAQVSLAGSTLGGIFLNDQIARIRSVGWQRVAVTALVIVATIAPLGIPSIGAEATWALGLRYPRMLDWREAEQLAGVIEQGGRPGELVNVYYASFGPALAVFAPIQVQRGHWVEVQPKVDPASFLSVTKILYVIPVPPTDTVLRDVVSRGWVRLLGGTSSTSVMALERPLPASEVTRWFRETAPGDAEWLAANATNNVFPARGVVLSSTQLAAWRARFLEQRAHAGRLELATLVQALAEEGRDQVRARELRGDVRGWGSLAAFLGDESCIDFESEARHELLRKNLAQWALAARSLDDSPDAIRKVDEASATVFDSYFWAA